VQPDDGERKALIGITGMHVPAGVKRMTVTLADLDATLSAATGVGLAGKPQPTPWDPELAKARRSTGRAVYEEVVVDQLIADLSDWARHLGGSR
jgi:hypothetical protein